MSFFSENAPRRATVVLCCVVVLCANFSRASRAGDAPPAKLPPRIVKTTPERGATDVSATEIVVVFDQDMLPGFSWMSGPAFPETTGKPVWRDKRTCALPVKLERGKFYRIGINSDDERFQNFTNEIGAPAPPRVLWFVTEGASEAEKAKAAAPRVVVTVPANDAQDVDASLAAIVVTFDKPMSAGISWTGLGKQFPSGSAPSYWKDDRRTCVFPVRLKPDCEYEIGVNDFYDIQFQSADGVPVAPMKLRFKTRSSK